jgi:hypothetical protein
VKPASIRKKNEKRKYLKDKINELATNRKNKNQILETCVEKQMNFRWVTNLEITW